MSKTYAALSGEALIFEGLASTSKVKRSPLLSTDFGGTVLNAISGSRSLGYW